VDKLDLMDTLHDAPMPVHGVNGKKKKKKKKKKKNNPSRWWVADTPYANAHASAYRERDENMILFFFVMEGGRLGGGGHTVSKKKWNADGS